MHMPTPDSASCLFDRLSPSSRHRIATISAKRAHLMLESVRAVHGQALLDGVDPVAAMNRAIEHVRATEMAEVNDAAFCEDWTRLYASNLLLGSFLTLVRVSEEEDVARVMQAMEFMASLRPASEVCPTLQ